MKTRKRRSSVIKVACQARTSHIVVVCRVLSRRQVLREFNLTLCQIIFDQWIWILMKSNRNVVNNISGQIKIKFSCLSVTDVMCNSTSTNSLTDKITGYISENKINRIQISNWNKRHISSRNIVFQSKRRQIQCKTLGLFFSKVTFAAMPPKMPKGNRVAIDKSLATHSVWQKLLN